ncbi:hypothetical protein QC761_205530 [Podospora bellae-mahoneyi]|uniref:Ribonucleases P/MRP subunit Pop8-like domain-containing protein n=1 Tax=Podospora bellae-mahoneyi TaxID=2093777 RepID=A0ABR0FRX2_9PEZI|nr:hypothetical protein QC761_205530 [Podospora bellae-mahoneyi]
MTEAMDLDPPPPTSTTSLPKLKTSKLLLTTLTLPTPPFSYANLTLLTPSPSTTQQQLDPLLLKSYLTSALSQFLGQTGAAIPIDILQVGPASSWVRLPRPDLAAFTAAIASFSGLNNGKEKLVLRVEAAGDFLGALVDRGEEREIWGK